MYDFSIALVTERVLLTFQPYLLYNCKQGGQTMVSKKRLQTCMYVPDVYREGESV